MSANVAVEIIKQNMYATIATVDNEGQPWASPVFVVYDNELSFYWASGRSSQHSRNIKTQPRFF